MTIVSFVNTPVANKAPESTEIVTCKRQHDASGRAHAVPHLRHPGHYRPHLNTVLNGFCKSVANTRLMSLCRSLPIEMNDLAKPALDVFIAHHVDRGEEIVAART